MRDKKVMKLASRGKRFGAYCIDAIVPVIACFIYVIASIVMLARYAMNFGSFGYGYGYPGFGYGYGGRTASGGVTAAMVIATLLIIAYMVIQLVFYNKSKTLGKAALGLQVVSSIDGEPIGFWKMLFREWFVKQASAAIFLLGFIWVLVDEKNRGWHDKILDTYVVDLKETEAMNRIQRQYRPEKPAPKSDPIYSPSVSEAAGTSAAALADKIQPVPQPIQEIPSERQISAAPETLEDIVAVDNTGAEIRDSVIEVAEVVAVAAQDAVSKVTDYDRVLAETAEDMSVSTVEVPAEIKPAEVQPEEVQSVEVLPEEILNKEEPSAEITLEAEQAADEQE